MPTPSEQKALAFVVIVILLGGAVRVLRAGATTPPTQAQQQGIVRQAHAADSASKAQSARQAAPRSRARARTSRRDSSGTVITGVVPIVSPFSSSGQPPATSPLGFPPPSPRIDVDYRRPAVPASKGALSATDPQARLDLDNATAQQLEGLPALGPAMARRIVANRDSFGPFKAIENLRRVRGIGPKTLARLAPLVTFGAR